MHPSENLNKKLYDNHYKEESKMKTQNHDFQFYITRYPFPNGPVAFQIKFYKTFYECQGFHLTNDKISRLTALNRLTSLIKLKQIVKYTTRQKNIQNEKFESILVHSYSLYYQIVPNFILSPTGISIIKSLNELEIKNLFEDVIQDIDHLIANKIFYLLDVQNIAISSTGKVKIYIPANNIIENVVFTDKHKKEMKLTANKVIGCLQRHITNHVFSNCKIDVESVKTEIKKQLQSLQINGKNIESQIFTFNQNYQKQAEKNYQFQNQLNQSLQKITKIRKSSQKIYHLPEISIQKVQNNLTLSKYKGDHLKCETARQFVSKQYQKNDDIKNIYLNNSRQNIFCQQKLKDYEIKLQTLDHTVKQIKQQMRDYIKKDNQKQTILKKHGHDRLKSKTYANLPHVNQQFNDVDVVVQKLSSSRLQIKKLLLDETDLRQSYHLQQEQKNNENQQFILKREIQNLFGFTFPQSMIQSPKHKVLEQIKKQDHQPLLLIPKNLKNFVQGYKLDEIKQVNSNPKSGQNQKSKKSPDSFNEQSSWGKQSPPGGNPFRQYGNFRIQYVIDEQAIPNTETNDVNQGGQIKVYHQPTPEPLKQKIITKKQHFLTPLSHLQENFRYSSLALQNQFPGQLFRISIPENIYDPTQYDSIDTYQMEVGRDHKMPRIVSKAAFRHTLFPSPIFGRVKPTKDVQKSQQKIALLDSQKEIRQDRSYKSVDRKTYTKQIKLFNGKQQDSLSQKRSKKDRNLIPELIYETVKIEASKDVNNSLIVPEKVQKQNLFQNQRNQREIQSEYERLSKTNKEVSRFRNIQISPEKNSNKNLQLLQQKLSMQNNKKTFDKQKIKAILNRSKEIITRYKNFPIKKQ